MHAFHRTDSKDSDVHVLDGVNASNKNTPSTHHPRRRNVTTLMVGFKKKKKKKKTGHIRKNLTPKMVNPRDISGERKTKNKTKKKKQQQLRKAEKSEEWRKLVVKSTLVPKRSARLNMCKCQVIIDRHIRHPKQHMSSSPFISFRAMQCHYTLTR